MAAVAGVRGTGNWGTDERPKDFREMILFRNPNGTAPIFAMTSKMGKKTVRDPEFSWWDEPNDLVRLQVKGALADSATDVVVDSTDPNAANPDRRWGDPRHLVPGDLLMVEPATDSATFSPEIVRVVAPSTAATAAPSTTFAVARGQAGTAAAAIADNLYLLKIGSAFEEGTRAPLAASRNPIKYSNYTQIFKNVYSVTGTAAETHARTGDAVVMDKKRKSFDHARDIELAILFGQKHEDTSGGQPRRFMGGLRDYIPNAVLSASWTLTSLIDSVSKVFDWDSMAGDSRMVFAGNGALNKFNQKIEAQSNAHQINFRGEERMYGVRFNRYVVPQGDLMIKTHPLLSRHPLYTNSWFVIDGSQLKWCPLRNRDTRFKDNIEHNDEDAEKGQWLTEGSIMVDGGGLTMRYIGGFNL